MRRRFGISLLLGLAGFVAVTVVLLSFVFDRSTRDLLVDASDARLESAARNRAAAVDAFLAPVQDTAARTSGLISADIVQVDDPAELDRFLVEQLRTQDGPTSVYLGGHDGSFSYVSRLRPDVLDDVPDTPGSWWVRRITTGESDAVPGGRVEQWQHLGADLAPLERLDVTSDYDPRARPWFTPAAASSGAPVWSEPYELSSTGTLGLTASADAGGSGVVGVDVDLAAVDELLAAANLGEGGVTFLVDDRWALIAHQDPDQVVLDEGSPRLAAEGEDPLVAASAQVVVGPPEQIAELEVDGERWWASAGELETVDGWRVVVAIPEAQVVDEIVDLQRRNTIVALLVGVLVVGLAVPAVRLVARRVARVEERATTDALTELPNRRGVDAAFGRLWAEQRRGHGVVTAAAVDVDEFKQTNDRFGHAAGDLALQAVAGRLRHNLRDGDVVGRLGGDEFVVLLGGTDREEAVAIMDRARALIASEPVRDASGRDIPLRVTVGVASVRFDAEAPEAVASGAVLSELISEADEALFVAKRAGRNRVATTAGVVTTEPG